MGRIFACIVLLAGAGLLAACATMPPSITESDNSQFRQRQASLHNLDQWQVTGRIAFKIDDEGGTGAMTWAQTGTRHEVQLSRPIGRGCF